MTKIEDLFAAALGLAVPWRVARVEFDLATGTGQLDLHVDLADDARFPCPEGDQAACPVHDTEPASWRYYPDFFQYPVFLHAPLASLACPTHGIRQVRLACAQPATGLPMAHHPRHATRPARQAGRELPEASAAGRGFGPQGEVITGHITST